MSSNNENLSRCQKNGRYGPGEVDRIKILREGLSKSLAELKAQDKVAYCLAVKEIIGEMEKMRLQMTNRAMELSILSQQSNQLMETYNETLNQPLGRYSASISSFSAVLDRPARTMLDVSYRAHLNPQSLESENCLSRIQEEPRRNLFGSNELSNGRLNGDKTNTSMYRAPGLLPTARFHESIRVGSYPSHPIRKFNMPGFLRPNQDRREPINSTLNPLPKMSKERTFAPTLLSSVEPPCNRYSPNEAGVNDKVVLEVSTRNSTPSAKSSDLADAVSDCDSIEEVGDRVIDEHRRNSQSSDASKREKSLEKLKPAHQRKKGKPTTVAEFVLKKWSVALKSNELLLVGQQCDKRGRVLQDNHNTATIQTRKQDGSIQTKNGIYVLVGPPAWSRPTDPPTPVKKLFDKKFPTFWRQAAKIWKLEQSKKKKKSKHASKSPHPKNHSRKKSRESSSNDSGEEPSLEKQSKIKQGPSNTVKSKTNVAKNISQDEPSASSDSDDEPSPVKRSKRNPEPSTTRKTAKSKKMTIKEIRKERPSPSVEPNPPIRPKTKPAPSAANKPVKSPEIRKNKSAEKKRAGAKIVEEVKNDWQEEGEEYDLFDQLDLVVPKIGIPAMTPTTFCKALSKNEVRIGTHTPTLKTFVDDLPSVSIPVTPLPGPGSKLKKDDVVAMRMAKAIESGNEPSRGSGKNGAGTFKAKNGVEKTAVNANKEAIDEIIRMQKKKTGGATPKIIKKIREGRDDSEDESSETDSD